MKKANLLFIASYLLCTWAYGQCDTKQYADKGIKILSQEGGFTFLKSYPVSSPEGKQYSYIFSQGTEYMIALANHHSDTKGIYITLYDSSKKEIATSLTDSGEFYPAIAFKCSRTGIYHMQFSFTGTKKHCAAGVLGMRR